MGFRLYKPFDLVQKHANRIAVIIINSPRTGFSSPLQTIWNNAKIRLCTDGAANSLIELCRSKIMEYPGIIVGDFDSITEEANKFFSGRLRHQLDQDSTDLSKTLKVLMEMFHKSQTVQTKIDGILLFGGFTGRFDHVLGTLNAMLLQIQSHPDIPIYGLDDQNFITILPQGESYFELSKQHLTGNCGLLPIVQKRTIVNTKGLKWELNETELEYGKLVSTSNYLIRPEQLHIQSNEPLVFTFELKEPNGML